MYRSIRHNAILNLLHERNEMTVKELSEQLYASPSTIRRDLQELQQLGYIRHYYGGAVLIDASTDAMPIEVRRNERSDRKNAIGLRALEMISEGDVIFVDASSTALTMVEHLSKFKNLTVLTNGLRALEIMESMNVNAFSTGGQLLRNSMALVGRFAERMIEEANFDKCFFSISGISADGILSDNGEAENRIHRMIVQKPCKRVCLCDSAKLASAWMYRTCTLSDLDYLISDADVFRFIEQPEGKCPVTIKA